MEPFQGHSMPSRRDQWGPAPGGLVAWLAQRFEWSYRTGSPGEPTPKGWNRTACFYSS